MRGKRVMTGLGGKELAAKIGWDQSKLSLLENGVTTPTDADLAAVLTICGVKGDDLAFLVGQWRRAREETWFQDIDTFGEQDVEDTLLAELDRATWRGGFFPVGVPEQLEVPAGGPHSNMVHSCPVRRSTCRFYVGASVLQGLAASSADPAEQFVHLLQHCGSIRIVPDGVVMRPAETFYLLENDGSSPIVCVQTAVGTLYLESWHHIAQYRSLLDELDVLAMPSAHTHEYIAHVADQCAKAESLRPAAIALQQGSS